MLSCFHDLFLWSFNTHRFYLEMHVFKVFLAFYNLDQNQQWLNIICTFSITSGWKKGYALIFRNDIENLQCWTLVQSSYEARIRWLCFLKSKLFDLGIDHCITFEIIISLTKVKNNDTNKINNKTLDTIM
jgi:hypothetical protein